MSSQLFSNSSPRLKLVAGLFGMFILGGVTVANVTAAIPDATGTIHACYTTGLLPTFRIIDGSTCNSGETHLTWKQGGSATGVLRSDIAGKDLSGAQMVYWDLGGMNLAGTILGSANLTGADLRGATVTNANFSNANLAWSNLSNLTFTGASLVGADLDGATLTGANFSTADLGYSNFHNQNISGKNLSGVSRFEAMVMNGGNMSGTTLPSSPSFKDATLINTNLGNNNFSGGYFAGANLTGSTFTSSNTSGVTWVDGVKTATCPDGVLASDFGNTCAGHLTP